MSMKMDCCAKRKLVEIYRRARDADGLRLQDFNATTQKSLNLRNPHVIFNQTASCIIISFQELHCTIELVIYTLRIRRFVSQD